MARRPQVLVQAAPVSDRLRAPETNPALQLASALAEVEPSVRAFTDQRASDLTREAAIQAKSDAIRASGGIALAGREETIAHWMREACRLEGIAICPETAVCFDCLEQMVKTGQVKDGEDVVVFNTGAAQKYPEAVQENLAHVDCTKPIDWARI